MGEYMTNNLIFRLVMLLFFIGITFNRLFYYRKEMMIESLITIKKDMFDRVMSTILGILWFIVLFLYVIDNQFISLFQIKTPLYISMIGLFLGIMGYLLHFFSHKALGKHFSPHLIIKKDQMLITKGPYRFIRHPIYTAYFIFSISFFMISSNLLIGLTWFFGMVLLSFFRIPSEEKMLSDEFGQKYNDYKKNTGMFLPKLIR